MTGKTTNGTTTPQGSMTARYVIIAGIIIAAFFGSYSLAVARANRVTNAGVRTAARGAVPAAKTAGSSPACACCGTGGSSAPVEGAAALQGDVQKVAVDTSSGSYNPNTIKLKAGVPAEITFTQSSGCLGQVEFPDLGIAADLSAGATTIKLPALDAGTYGFNCGMQMVFGTLVVE
jgi:hypothetical protein